MKKVQLNKSDLTKAEKFADLRCNENQELYQKRGGFKREDIVTGALAEIAVYKLLKSYGFDIGKPDFTIHEARKKSFDADLTDGNFHFHVKGQSLSSAKKYGESWLMQRRDPIINEGPRKHFIVPCVVDDVNLTVNVHGIIPIRTLLERFCFSECRLTWFQKYKVALYEELMDCVLTRNSRWGIFYRR